MEKQTAFTRKINADLNELFGIEHTIITDVIFKNYHGKNTDTKSRVL